MSTPRTARAGTIYTAHDLLQLASAENPVEHIATTAVVLADDETDALVMDTLARLEAPVLEDLKNLATAIQHDLEATGSADIGPMMVYLRGAMQSESVRRTIARLVPGLAAETPPGETSEGVPIGVLYVIAVLVIVAGILALVYVLYFGKWSDVLKNFPTIGGPIIIHGPNDPNGPIGGMS